MAYPPQQESFLARNKVVIGVLVVLVILYIMNKDSVDAWIAEKKASQPPANTPTGGVTTPNNPAVTQPAPGTPAVVGSTTPAVTPLVKIIEVTKDSSNMQQGGDNSDWRTFQIGEVKVYTAAGLLSAADFESASYTSAGGAGYALSFPATNAYDGNPGTFTHTDGNGGNVHQLTLKLKQLQKVVKVEVLNRTDCCQSRLAGAVISLKSSGGEVLKQQTLTAGNVQLVVV